MNDASVSTVAAKAVSGAAKDSVMSVPMSGRVSPHHECTAPKAAMITV